MTHDKTIKEGQNMKAELESKILSLVTEFEEKTGVVVEYIDVNKTIDKSTYKHTGITESVTLRVRI